MEVNLADNCGVCQGFGIKANEGDYWFWRYIINLKIKKGVPAAEIAGFLEALKTGRERCKTCGGTGTNVL